jgi:ribosome-binding protein aMBF1 (putative translation factor)
MSDEMTGGRPAETVNAHDAPANVQQDEEQAKARLIGARIRAARALKGMQQKDLAKAVDKSQSLLSRIEEGDRGLDVLLADDLCRILDCGLEWLVRGDGPAPHASLASTDQGL